MTGPAQRLPHVDLFKAVASQLIVLHHLAFYGPMADQAALLAPALFAWLAQHARLAVQVFLVLGGYLAARQLAPAMRLRDGEHRLGLLLARLWQRYLRLVLPLAAMLLVAMLAATVARRWLDHDSIPAAPSLMQLLAHLALLQDLIGQEALSAGVWYVAIDFQLFALLLGVLAAAALIERWLGLQPTLAPGLVAAGVAASLLYFNRDAGWDVAAPYFFGAYGLGALAAWWIAAGRPRWPALGMVLLVLLALALEWRSRIAVAATVALVLALASTQTGTQADTQVGWLRGSAAATVRWLAAISYAVFLIHFPVCLVVNAAFNAFLAPLPWLQAGGVLLAWGLSVGAGWWFHRTVELPTSRWLTERRAASTPAAA